MSVCRSAVSPLPARAQPALGISAAVAMIHFVCMFVWSAVCPLPHSATDHLALNISAVVL